MNEQKQQVTAIAQVRVMNKLGLHTRPATAIVRLLHKAKCQVWFVHKQDRINAKSILSILMLAAKKNSSIRIEAEGEDAEEVVNNLVGGFKSGFGE